MASTASPSLPHRSVSTIRGGGGGGGGPGGSGSGRPEPTTPGGGSSSRAVPRTPVLRTTPSAFGSPSAVRSDEDTIVLELGARRLRVGLAGDPVYRGTVAFCPEQQRRVGDLRFWQDGYRRDWRAVDEERSTEDDGTAGDGVDDGSSSTPWNAAYELWQLDVRRVDLGLVSDKLERALREAFTKYLLIDSRPRRVILVVQPALPIPLLATTLDTLFGRFQSSSVALLSTPVAAAAAAGLRNALVVDLGWAETVVTSVFEYREVASTRTVRAGRMLIQNVHDLLADALSADADDTGHAQKRPRRHRISFEECEDVAARLAWCRPASRKATPGDKTATATSPSSTTRERAGTASTEQPYGAGLATVAEMDEPEESGDSDDADGTTEASYNTAAAEKDPAADASVPITEVPLQSCVPPQTVRIAFDQLAEPCERTFFGAGGRPTPGVAVREAPERDPDSPASWDDHELPVPLLVYRHLLRLPLDVRAVCMARLVFVGGATHVLGLRARIVDEVARLVAEQGWSGVRGKGPAQAAATRAALRQQQLRSRQQREGATKGAPAAAAEDSEEARAADAPPPSDRADEEPADAVWHDAANAQPEADPVEETLRKTRGGTAQQPSSSSPAAAPGGQLAAAASLGAWSGASLLAQLRVPALATVDREQWQQQGGAAAAARPADVDIKLLQRQSLGMGAGGSGGSSVLRTAAGGHAGGGGAGAAGPGSAGSGTASWTLGAWGLV